MIQNTNRDKFLKQKSSKEILVTKVSDLDVEHRRANQERLWRYRMMWDAMLPFRQRRRRNKDYFHGKQWSDFIVDPKNGKRITEEQNIINQGKIPLKNNLIASTINSILGVFRQSYGKPEVIARNQENQTLGEMNTCMAEFLYQTLQIKELDAKSLLEFMISGLVVQMNDYQWDDEKNRNEEIVSFINTSRVFMNWGVEDPRGKDITTLGVIMDMTIEEIKQRFANTPAQAKALEEIYKLQTVGYLSQHYRTFTQSTTRDLDFFVPEDPKACRVIQAWEKEAEETYLVHDHMFGTIDKYPVSDKKAIEDMIKEREIDIEYNGYDYESCKIEMQYHTETYWYVRYLSPLGDILYEGRTPFNHNSHPFTVCMGHLIDGEIHSYVENIIDQQRYINRLITLIDFILGASAKGVLVFPESAIPKNMTKEDIAEQWTSYNGIIFANIKPGVALPTQISANASTVGLSEMLQVQMNMMPNVSGVHGAMQGKEPKSNTASSLYAQQAQNSQVNVMDLLETFMEFRTARDYKMLKIAPQCYDAPFYISVSGREYERAAHMWDPKAAADTDIYVNLTESNNTAVYRLINNQIMIKAMEMGLVDFETVLQSGVVPNGEKLLTIVERRKQQLQMQQAQAQAAMMQGQATGAAMAEGGATESEILQQGADTAREMLEDADTLETDPRAMEMLNQALM